MIDPTTDVNIAGDFKVFVVVQDIMPRSRTCGGGWYFWACRGLSNLRAEGFVCSQGTVSNMCCYSVLLKFKMEVNQQRTVGSRTSSGICSNSVRSDALEFKV
jgi:hypothetical protein